MGAEHILKDKASLTDHQFEIHLHAIDKKEMNKDDRLKIMVFREKASDFQKRFFYRKGSPQLELVKHPHMRVLGTRINAYLRIPKKKRPTTLTF